MVEDVLAIFESFLPGHKWEIQKPDRGWRKRCYIASNGIDRYFIKFDVPVDILKRVGEIGVAPRVLSCGECDGIPFVIQEYVNGTHPENRKWLRGHVDALATTVRTYHEDPELFRQLAGRYTTGLRQHLGLDLQWLSGRFSACDAPTMRTRGMEAGFERLLKAAGELEAVPLVPVHNDPSPTNLLITGDNRLLLIDWDEIILSDPMRDIGLLLWWNFPPQEWPAFFDRYGMQMSESHVIKIYWFAARASCDIALWHAEHNLDGRSFVEDFLAALDKQPNPKGYQAVCA